MYCLYNRHNLMLVKAGIFNIVKKVWTPSLNQHVRTFYDKTLPDIAILHAHINYGLNISIIDTLMMYQRFRSAK